MDNSDADDSLMSRVRQEGFLGLGRPGFLTRKASKSLPLKKSEAGRLKASCSPVLSNLNFMETVTFRVATRANFCLTQ